MEVDSHVKKRGYSTSYWDRQVYISKDFDEADTLVVILPGQKFQCTEIDMPNGVKKDIKEALIQGKNIYLAYKTAGNGFQFYNMTIQSHFYGGLSGTFDKALPPYNASYNSFLTKMVLVEFPEPAIPQEVSSVQDKLFEFVVQTLNNSNVDKRAYLLV